MGETKIQWTATVAPDGTIRKGYTVNAWVGCTAVSPACDHCYAEDWANRMNFVQWGPYGDRRKTSIQNWNKVRKWNKLAAAEGLRMKVFCSSLADVFDNHKSIDPSWRSDLWALIRETPWLDWLLLTKRPQNIKRYLPEDWGPKGYPNVWLGTTVENQEEANRRIPVLLDVPAVVHFLSCEPLLGPVDLTRIVYPQIKYETGIHYQDVLRRGFWSAKPCFRPSQPDEPQAWFTNTSDQRKIDWVICGGESGSQARPMHPDWARKLRDDCEKAGVAYHFKQWGEWKHGSDFAPDAKAVTFDGRVIEPTQEALRAADREEALAGQGATLMRRVGVNAAGRELDGREWNDVPVPRVPA